MSKSNASAKTSGRAPKTPVKKPKRAGLYPYEAPATLKVNEPAAAYEVAPLSRPIEDTLSLLAPTDLADVLEISSKTLTRWRNKGEELTPQQTDRIARIEAIFDWGERVVGSRDEMLRWIQSRVHSLNGKRPIDLLKTESGRRQVEDALHAIEWGVLS
jgi:putative toxin-antitoxin system antitoxin component (TIGR02293 family)